MALQQLGEAGTWCIGQSSVNINITENTDQASTVRDDVNVTPASTRGRRSLLSQAQHRLNAWIRGTLVLPVVSFCNGIPHSIVFLGLI